MGSKRPREDDGLRTSSAKKPNRGGFKVGPANLPDGTYRRKVEKIKDNLIKRAKIKKDFAKVQKAHAEQEQADGIARRPTVYENIHDDEEDSKDNEHGAEEQDPVRSDKATAADKAAPSNTPHPDRIALMNDDAPPQQQDFQDRPPRHDRRRNDGNPRQRPNRFVRETEVADQRRQAAEQRQKEYLEAQEQRKQKTEERERFRRAMAKAKRPGRDGKQRLGRESGLLLEKVKKMMAE